jgi:ABC-type multidrug transport system ATPase subunit
MVVGPCGCGKSTFINGLIGENNIVSGTQSVFGRIAYVPQEAWLVNATVRENILFGLPYQEEAYRDAVGGAMLWTDINRLEGGDACYIGEKGLNLSGGQKQRVSLARAAYAVACDACDIVLLDDPLSALDASTAKAVFDNLLGRQGLFSNVSRVLVTHATQYLKQADLILVLNEGKQVFAGDFKGLELEVSKHSDSLATCVNNEINCKQKCDRLLLHSLLHFNNIGEDEDSLTEKINNTANPREREDSLSEVQINNTANPAEECPQSEDMFTSPSPYPYKYAKTKWNCMSPSTKNEYEIYQQTTKLAKANNPNSTISNLMSIEGWGTDVLSWSVLVKYLSNAGGRSYILCLLVTITVERVFYASTDFWMAVWTEANKGNMTLGIQTTNQMFYLVVYMIICLGAAVFANGRTRMIAHGGGRAAQKLFADCLDCLLAGMIAFIVYCNHSYILY